MVLHVASLGAYHYVQRDVLQPRHPSLSNALTGLHVDLHTGDYPTNFGTKRQEFPSL